MTSLEKSSFRQRPHSFTMPTKQIKISRAFRATTPNPENVARCEKFFTDNGYFDRDMILNQNGFLIDGYIAYLTARKRGLESLPVIQINIEVCEREPVPVTIQLSWKERLLGKTVVCL